MKIIQMISARSGWLRICALLFIMISASSMANLITNGDFENGATGWTLANGGEAGAVIAVNTDQSPFSSGSKALQMTDGTGSGSQYALKDFGAQVNGQYEFSFDYKMVAANASEWIGRLRNSGTPDASVAFTIGPNYLRVMSTGVSSTLSVGTWYHVSMILDSANDKILSGSITPYGGSAITWGEIAGFATAAQIKQLIIIDNSIPNVAPSIVLDNVSLNAIPEPATIGMLGLGSLITLLIRRRIL